MSIASFSLDLVEIMNFRSANAKYSIELLQPLQIISKLSSSLYFKASESHALIIPALSVASLL